MSAILMKLAKKSWQLGPELASADQSGFGRIYTATAEDGSTAVIKLIPKAPGAVRELLFESLSGTPHVLPILDTGEWQNMHILVMPLADKSLLLHLRDADGPLSLDEALPILLDVAETLARLEYDVVHRDLKPANVLLYQAHWCLADFGIARYAAASTAADTRMYSMTPPYAAPEQWRTEHATSRTDIYAFGVMMFELLQGHLPFPGPDTPDWRDQHLNQSPPALTGCPAPIASLVSQCLMKAAGARPAPEHILKRLQTSQTSPSAAAAKLQAANAAIVGQQAEQSAKASAQQSLAQQRAELANAAKQLFSPIRDALIDRISEAAPALQIAQGELRLGNGRLAIASTQAVPAGCLGDQSRPARFDVIAHSSITVRQPRNYYGYEVRSHSLWFCDAHVPGEYRWFETAFMIGVFIREASPMHPFDLAPTDEDAAGAFSSPGYRMVDWEPLPFDQGDEGQFIERWLEWFGVAVDGKLIHPREMPEHSGGRHR